TAFGRLLEELLEERHTPTAPGPRSSAFGELASDPGLVQANVILQLPPRHAEAQTDVIVEVHETLLRLGPDAFDRECDRLAGAGLHGQLFLDRPRLVGRKDDDDRLTG